MKKLIINRYFLSFVFVATFAFTTGVASAGDIKIGGVDLQKILDKSIAGKEALNGLKMVAEREKKALEDKQHAFRDLKKELEQQSMMMRESTMAEKEKKLRRLKREIELYREDAQQTIQKEQSRIMRKLLKSITKIIDVYAKENGYSLILEKGQGPNPLGVIVLYMDDAIEVTPAIIEIYDKEYSSSKGKAKK